MRRHECKCLMRAGALWSDANDNLEVQYHWAMDNSLEAYTFQEEAAQMLQGLSDDEVRHMDGMLASLDSFL